MCFYSEPGMYSIANVIMFLKALGADLFSNELKIIYMFI